MICKLSCVLAHILFNCGHYFSMIPYHPYSVYNWLMIKSFLIQNYCECNGPWKDKEIGDEI